MCTTHSLEFADHSGFLSCAAGQWLTYTLQPKLQPFMMATSLNHGYLRYTVNQTTLAAQVRHLPAHLSTRAPYSSIVSTAHIHPVVANGQLVVQKMDHPRLLRHITLAQSHDHLFGLPGPGFQRDPARPFKGSASPQHSL